ncbi:O-antigen ligase family protein [Mycobacterium sp. IS-1742]|uniref:O-antigen ligase family protein n=1 Tax=Mycobacterium sp. IS-1742 TaxID=1772285 RepID=UPI000AA67F30|nr:O-antigen ligase family protein [Mycobacterium sp. IS-1742]
MTPLQDMRPEVSQRTGSVALLLGIAAATVAVRLPGSLSQIYPSSVIVVIALLTVVCTEPRQLFLIRLSSLDVALVVFVAIRILTDVTNSATLDVALPIPALADWVIILLAFVSARAVVNLPSELVTFLRYFLAPGYFVAAIGVLQIAGVGVVTRLVDTFTRSAGLDNRIALGWTELRATSTIGHWTALGGYLVVMIAGSCALIAYTATCDRKKTWRYVAGLNLLMGGLLSTATFAPIIAGFVVILFTILLYFRRIESVLLAGGPALAFLYLMYPVLSDRYDKQTYETTAATTQYAWLPESMGYRMNIWVTEAIPAGLRREFVGWGSWVYSRIGESATPPELRWPSPESEWIRTFVTGGWLLLAAEVVLLLILIFKVARISRLYGSWIQPVLWGIVGLIVISTVHSHFTNRGVPLAIWPIAGAVLSAFIARYPGRADAERLAGSDRREEVCS